MTDFKSLGRQTQSEIEQVEGQGRPEGSLQDTVPHWTVSVTFPNSRKGEKDQLARNLDHMADSRGGEPGQTSMGPSDFSMSYHFEAGDANTGSFIMMVLNKYKDAEVSHDEQDVMHPSEESMQSRAVEGYILLAELSARQRNYQAEGVSTLTLDVLENEDGKTIKLALRGEPADLVASFPKTEKGLQDALQSFESRTASYKLTALEQEKLRSAVFSVTETRLTYSQRKSLPDSAFALPGRKYPIHDRNHAKDSLARVSAHGTESQISAVKAAVRKRYPSMKVARESFDIQESRPVRNIMTNRVRIKRVTEGSADARALRDQIKQAKKNISHQERQMREMTRSLSGKALDSARKAHSKTMAGLQKAKTELQKQLAKAMVKESVSIYEDDDDLPQGREQEPIEPNDQAMKMVLQAREKPVYAHGYKTKDGNWYLDLAKEGQDKKDAVAYGPFADEDELRQYMIDRSMDLTDLKMGAGGKKETPATSGDKGWETSAGLRGFRSSPAAKDPEEHEKDIGDTMKLKPTDGKEASKVTAKSIMSANPKLYTKVNQTPK